jgi:hypothetical protein
MIEDENEYIAIILEERIVITNLVTNRHHNVFAKKRIAFSGIRRKYEESSINRILYIQ